MSTLLIQNARIVDAFGQRTGDVACRDGRLVPVGDAAYDRVIDAGGLTLMPALVDMHCHLRDPGYPQKETMETGMRAALHGGYGTVTAMANTLPVTQTPAQVTENLEKAAALSLCNLIQAAAAGEGLADETPTDRKALAAVTRVLSNDGNTIRSDAFMERLLCDSREYGFLVSTHCQPERATVRRDLTLLARTGGNLHVGHISTAETAAMIREAKRAGLPVTCEVMPHHLFGWDDGSRVNPPLRTRADAQALIEGIADGTIDCLATDHAPHTPADKVAGMAGISNFDYALPVFLAVFHDNGLPLTLLSRMASLRPAELLHLKKGRVEAGYDADLTLIDPDAETVIEEADMLSRSHNTPFFGRAVRGRVLMTVVGGEVRFARGGAFA